MNEQRRPRRVLIIVENLPVPFDRRVWLEATTLARNGYSVSVICPKAKGWTAGYERLEDIDIYRYPIPLDAGGALGFIVEFAWCFLASAWLSLRIQLFGRGFDVLHACNPPDSFWLLGRFWSLFGGRFLFDHHDLCPEMYAAKFDRADGPFYRGLLWLERQAFRAARVVVTTNESHKRIAVERGGKRPDDVFVVRSGPDLKRFKHYPADPAYRRDKTHLLVYLGEICKQDGVDHLVRTVKLLRDELGRTDFFCLFVGGGPHQPVIKRYAEEEGILDVAAFTGRVSDEELCRILSSATIGVDPDPKNPWSDKSTMNKVVEYMYFGLPVAAYDLHETRVSAAEAGAYAEANSEIALARAIDALLDDAPRRAAMAEAGRRRVADTLAWDHSVAPLLAAYDQAFRRREGRGASTAGHESPQPRA
jgi:glycosyltransferase involved in cell wall biosynthesis